MNPFLYSSYFAIIKKPYNFSGLTQYKFILNAPKVHCLRAGFHNAIHKAGTLEPRVLSSYVSTVPRPSQKALLDPAPKPVVRRDREREEEGQGEGK